MRFKAFMLIFFTLIAGVSSVAVALFQTQKGGNSTTGVPNHFSVVWTGFAPPYGNQTPDYYMCINDLNDSVLNLNVALHIQNFENNSYYFLIDQYQTPPAGWTIAPYYIGNVAVDTGLDFVYSNIARTKPSSIPSGELTEAVQLIVKAYYDAAYSQFYSQDNFTVYYHFIDRTSTAWTKLYYWNFDDGQARAGARPLAE